MKMAQCNVCFRHCKISEGQTGFCGARTCKNGTIVPENYGRVTSLALDPIEKKPLYRFHPGSNILSVGSYGCNLRCPFCQNYSISWSDRAMEYRQRAEILTPEELVSAALRCQNQRNIGLAFTYNEPLIGYEFVRDTARRAHDSGLVNVLVTNGTAELSVLEEIAPFIDAMNIDLKGFTDHYYDDVLKGSRTMVMEFIQEAVKRCHIELTTLIVPGENDTSEEIDELSAWIAGLTEVCGEKSGNEIPLHITRFFPRFHMLDRQATDVSAIYRLADTARKHLRYVYVGNC